MPTDAPEAPVRWSTVEQTEHAFIRAQRAPLGDSAQSEGQSETAEESAGVGDMVGLAFSGGGIRSATFNLGILQGLAKLGLLEKVDYLSTVSGGGYIGGWFQAWLYRRYYELRVDKLEQLARAATSEGERSERERAVPSSGASLEARIGALERQHLEEVSASMPEQLLPRIIQPIEGRSFDDRLRKLEYVHAKRLSELPKASLPYLARRALAEVQAELAGSSRTGSTPHGPRDEPAPIRFLRDYSNYLTPRTGVFSADTWTLLVIYLRNLSLNALVLVLTGISVLLTVRGLAAAHQAAESFLRMNTLGAWAVSVGALVTGGYSLHSGLSVLGQAEEHQKHRDYVFRHVVVPLLAQSLLLSTLLGRLDDFPTADFWRYAPIFVLIIPSGGLVSLYLSARRQRILRVATGRSGKWLPAVALVGSVLSGLLGASLLKTLAALTDGPAGGDRIRSLLGVPLVLCIIALMLAVQVGIAGRGTTEYVREWSSRLMAHLLLLAAFGLGIGAIALHGSDISHWISSVRSLASGLTVGWVATTVSGLLAARGSERDSMPVVRSALISITPHVFSVGALLYLAVLIDIVDDTLCTWVANELEIAKVEQLPSLVQAGLLIAAGSTAAAIALFLSWRLGVNEFSLHALYRNRLIRCYLGAVRGDERQADVFTGFDTEDDSLRIDELGTHAKKAQLQSALRPYFLVNATLNLVVGQRLAWQFRRASSFVFSPFYSGYETRSPSSNEAHDPRRKLYDWGYRHTREYGGGISLGTAMAISGAALSPNMGARTTPAMALLMTLFNVRLGWWLGNPRHAETWNKPGPEAGLVHLLLELLGRATDSREYVYLSDGGHFENLGLYELVRRRCRYIVLSDAGEDAESNFADLGNAIEKCRVDFGVEIEIDVTPVQRDPVTGRSKSHCAVGRILYDRSDEQCSVGTLVYVKSTLTGCEPVDIRTYATANRQFPHQSTTDQWFDEAQFESYRALGEHVASSVFEFEAAKVRGTDSAESMFTHLRQRHLAAAPVRENTFAKHSEALGHLYEELRSNARLAFLDAQFYPEWNTLLLQALTPADLTRRERESLLPPRSEEEIPTKEEELRAGFYFCQQLIQLMESVYTDLNLELHHGHPDNRGWMNLFQHWAWSGTFRMTWVIMGNTTGVRFQNFCEQHLRLNFGARERRVDAIGFEATQPVKLAELAHAASRRELDLSRRECELLTWLAARDEPAANEPVWRCILATVQIVERRAASRTFNFPVGMVVLRDRSLVFLRTRDHQRKSGLARDIVINLARNGAIVDCEFLSDEGALEGAPQLEVHRFSRLCGELIKSYGGTSRQQAAE